MGGAGADDTSNGLGLRFHFYDTLNLAGNGALGGLRLEFLLWILVTYV